MTRLLILSFLFLLAGFDAHGQIRPKPGQPRSNSLADPRSEVRQSPEARALLEQVEQSILTGSIARLNPSFGKQVSMTVSGSESGYYSAGQASLILQNFFSTRKPAQFAFTRWNDSVSNPYATGRLTFVRRGSRESVQVYVSLARQDSRWVITQFNIY